MAGAKAEERWFEAFNSINELLRGSGIRHSFIKMLIDPFQWGDIDILIQNPPEIYRASSLLRQEGFKEGYAGRICPPNKKVFEREGFPPVEIYPKVAWKRLVVADEGEILSRSRLTDVRGIEVYLPPPDDDLYLVATHSISHMRVTEAEVMNASRLIDENPDFSWERVRDLASDFGTEVQTYFFLKALSSKLGEKIEIFDFKAKKLLDAWFSKKRDLTFPLEVPRIFGRLLPPFYHEPAMLKMKLGREIPHDFLSSLA